MPTTAEYGAYDIGNDRLARALARSAVPETLRDIVTLSRALFGWFNHRATRADEYVWITQKIDGKPGLTIVDIGTGVSPLPVFLAGRGHKLITIDNSTETRVPSRGGNGWNGWGFLNYAYFNSNILSLNCDAQSVNLAGESVDVCYAVSVVEHLRAVDRRCFWRSCWSWLKYGAQLLLTVDLSPGSCDLWNMNQGQIVEEMAEHGDMAGLAAELENTGFTIVEHSVSRDYPDAPPTDVGYIHCIKRQMKA
jgi:hypothetical protein